MHSIGRLMQGVVLLAQVPESIHQPPPKWLPSIQLLSSLRELNLFGHRSLVWSRSCWSVLCRFSGADGWW